jgi:hypothetical protein
MTDKANWNPTEDAREYVHVSGSTVISRDPTNWYRNPGIWMDARWPPPARA